MSFERAEQRRDKLRRLIRKAEAEAMLVTNETNVTYLTGFTGDSSYLLLWADRGEVMLSDARYTTQLEEECSGLQLEIRPPSTTILELSEKVINKAKITKLGIEADTMTLSQAAAFNKLLPKVELVSTSGLVEELREVKDKEEIGEIRKAIRLAEQAFAVVRAAMRPEQTERAIAHALENQIRLFGGDCCSFRPIVAVGPRAALPHYRSGWKKIDEDEFVLIDWGARDTLYVSDLTRVLVTGRISPKLQRIYGVVLKAQQAAIKAIRPGVAAKKVDAAARRVIERAGFGKKFGHSLGHGIGLQIHEAPRLAEKQDKPLKAGMVVTVEPGIYLPGWGGVRIEDDVLVTRGGHEVLSNVPKELEQCVVG